jgi:benzoate-CoA ligase
VPVAVNTLLTADDYAYMLEHCRAQAVLVSGALLPAVNAAMTKADHEVRKVVVSRPIAPLQSGGAGVRCVRRCARPAEQARGDELRRSRLLALLLGLHRTSEGHGALPRNPYWTCELYGKGILALREDDVCFRPPSSSSPMGWATR